MADKQNCCGDLNIKKKIRLFTKSAPVKAYSESFYSIVVLNQFSFYQENCTASKFRRSRRLNMIMLILEPAISVPAIDA